jgi:hypothetical protein
MGNLLINTDLVNEIQATAPEVKKTAREILLESILTIDKPVPMPEAVFSLDDIPVFTRKSIGTIIGKAKSGKTTVIAWIVAQLLNMDLKVLFIDTEQGDSYGWRTYTWILSLGRPHIDSNLAYVSLSTHQPIIRAQVMEEGLKYLSPDLVIIDGIKDLVYDINSAEEATIMSNNLMKLASDYNCHIVSIIHQNKGNEYARGHLGTELINKSETVIKVSQDETELIVCEPEFTRGKPFRVFAFTRDELGRPIIANYNPVVNSNKPLNKKGLIPTELDNSIHFEFLERAFNGCEDLCFADLVSALKASIAVYGTVPGDDRVKMFISHYTQVNYLEKLPKTSNKTFYKINLNLKLKPVERYVPF